MAVPALSDNRIVAPRAIHAHRTNAPDKCVFPVRGLCFDGKQEGNRLSSLWRYPRSARRGKSTAANPHREALARYKEDSARGLIFPPPKPRTGFSARHTSKDVGYPQPSSWRFPLITTRSAMASMIWAWKASCSTGLAFVLGMVISSPNNSSVCSRAAC